MNICSANYTIKNSCWAYDGIATYSYPKNLKSVEEFFLAWLLDWLTEKNLKSEPEHPFPLEITSLNF